VGIASTVPDMFRFAEMFRQDGTLDGARILSPATLALARRNWTGEKPNELYAARGRERGWDPAPAYIGLGFSLRGTAMCRHMFGTLASPGTFGNYGAGTTLFGSTRNAISRSRSFRPVSWKATPTPSASRNCRTWSFRRAIDRSKSPERRCAANRVLIGSRMGRDRSSSSTVRDRRQAGRVRRSRRALPAALRPPGERAPCPRSMDSVSETQVIAVVSAHVEPIGRLPASRVAIGGSEHQSAALASRNHVAVDFQFLDGNPSGHAGG